jgi:hypothetical protein
MNVHKCYLFGLGVHADIPLLADRVEECPADVIVRWVRNAKPSELRAVDSVASDQTSEIQLRWPRIGVMCVRNGSELELRTDPACDVNLLGHLVTGLGLGLILHQRGVLTLHASAVLINGVAMAFAGPKMVGKSTLAAAMVERGHTIISDDVVAIDLPGWSTPQVRWGAPYVKLWPDAAVRTGHDPAELPRVWSTNTKRVVVTRSHAFRDPASLCALIVLDFAAMAGAPLVEPLQGIAAFSELISNSHGFRWVQDRRCSALHLGQCRELLNRVGVYRLTRGKTMEGLASTSRLIEDLATSLRGGRPAESALLTQSATG